MHLFHMLKSTVSVRRSGGRLGTRTTRLRRRMGVGLTIISAALASPPALGQEGTLTYDTSKSAWGGFRVGLSTLAKAGWESDSYNDNSTVTPDISGTLPILDSYNPSGSVVTPKTNLVSVYDALWGFALSSNSVRPTASFAGTSTSLTCAIALDPDGRLQTTLAPGANCACHTKAEAMMPQATCHGSASEHDRTLAEPLLGLNYIADDVAGPASTVMKVPFTVIGDPGDPTAMVPAQIVHEAMAVVSTFAETYGYKSQWILYAQQGSPGGNRAFDVSTGEAIVNGVHSEASIEVVQPDAGVVTKTMDIMIEPGDYVLAFDVETISMGGLNSLCENGPDCGAGTRLEPIGGDLGATVSIVF